MLTPAARRPDRAALVLAAALAALAVATGAPPARADAVRNTQEWVLDDLNAPAAWQVSEGAGVTVALIDSGVDPNVPDLAGSVLTGPDLTGVHTPPSNPNWGVHGTWMASLISGHGHDGGADGIIGIAPQSHLLSIRVITDRQDPGYAAYQRQPLSQGQHELARAIRYAVRHKAGVISMSLSYSAQSRPVRSALQFAFSHNVVVVASSGNNGDAAEAAGKGSAPYSFPADYPGVLGVAAVGRDFQPASFSSDNISVQVSAPGVNVPAEGRDANYWLVSGTSPACALTAGVAALIKSKYPGLSAAEVTSAIASSTWHHPADAWDREVGFGTVNAAAALTAAAHLAATHQASRPVSAVGHFGGGPQAVPAPPVHPRGPLAAVIYALLALLSLALVIFGAWRLLRSRPPSAVPSSAPLDPSENWPPTTTWRPPSYAQPAEAQAPDYRQPDRAQPDFTPSAQSQPPYGPPTHRQMPDYAQTAPTSPTYSQTQEHSQPEYGQEHSQPEYGQEHSQPEHSQPEYGRASYGEVPDQATAPDQLWPYGTAPDDSQPADAAWPTDTASPTGAARSAGPAWMADAASPAGAVWPSDAAWPPDEASPTGTAWPSDDASLAGAVWPSDPAWATGAASPTDASPTDASPTDASPTDAAASADVGASGYRSPGDDGHTSEPARPPDPDEALDTVRAGQSRWGQALGHRDTSGWGEPPGTVSAHPPVPGPVQPLVPDPAHPPVLDPVQPLVPDPIRPLVPDPAQPPDADPPRLPGRAQPPVGYGSSADPGPLDYSPSASTGHPVNYSASTGHPVNYSVDPSQTAEFVLPPELGQPSAPDGSSSWGQPAPDAPVPGAARFFPRPTPASPRPESPAGRHAGSAEPGGPGAAS
jgi:Subtilase family